MPNYEYEKDYPFATFITNLGKYNEGELVGEWVKFPTTHDELQRVFERIGIGSADDFGQPYEEWFITDYDCYVGNLYDKLGEYENLDELNYLASKIDEMDRGEYNQFLAAMDMGDHSSSLQKIINLTENLDCYDIYPDIEDEYDLGYYYIQEAGIYDLESMGQLANYIDYERFGRDMSLDEVGHFTEFGYVRDTGSSFSEIYDGNRENIPEEYRVMTNPNAEEELTEDDRLDMATDLAFDLDEFFRQRDPQYAAEHPDEHSGKEQIADMLMDGKTRAIKEQLAAMAQEPDDDLPSRIAEYEDAIGYEDYLDIDTVAVREAADTFFIYQLKQGNETRDYRFESLDSLQRQGLSMKPENYDLIYTAPLTEKDNLESIFTRFNIDRPEDFKGHSLSVSDVVVFHQDGKETAHFCDSVGFTEVPQFLEPVPVPDNYLTGDTIRMPRGSFHMTDMTKEQMEAAGYGFHHASDDGRYNIMADSTRAFAIAAEQTHEKDNPLRTAEMTLEDDYGMIDGVINNGRRGEELEKAKEAAVKTEPDKKPSIMQRLEAAKKECAERKAPDKAAPHKKSPELGDL